MLQIGRLILGQSRFSIRIKLLNQPDSLGMVGFRHADIDQEGVCSELPESNGSLASSSPSLDS